VRRAFVRFTVQQKSFLATVKLRMADTPVECQVVQRKTLSLPGLLSTEAQEQNARNVSNLNSFNHKQTTAEFLKRFTTRANMISNTGAKNLTILLVLLPFLFNLYVVDVIVKYVTNSELHNGRALNMTNMP